MSWLNKIPLVPLSIVAIALALAPFGSEPHLWQKLTMLFTAELNKPLDIFDLFLHGTLLVLLLLKLIWQKK